MTTYLLVLLSILLTLLVLLGIFAILSRIRGGKYVQPIVMGLSKIGFMRRAFMKMSRARLERENPDLVSAMDKLQRLAGPNPDPQRAQRALSQLSPAERRAYLAFVDEQGAAPEPANRQMRRQKRLEGGPRPITKGAGKRRR